MVRSLRFEINMILLAGVMAYGLQIPFLGFFQDDWNFVYYYSFNGSQGLLELMTIDGRPGGVWVYAIAFNFFQYEPAFWQAFAIGFRILTAFVALLILHRLWPDRRNTNLTASIIFLVYPFFTLQPLSISFAQHYVAYFLLGLSLLLTIASIEQPEKYLWFTIPAVLLTPVHLFTVEYFVGLELLRVVVILVIFSRRLTIPAWKERLRKTFITWLPYVLMLALFIYWRSFVLASLGIRNNPLNILTDTGETALSVLQYLIADLVLMLGSSWANLLDPSLFIIGPIRNLYIAASLVVGGACFYFLVRAKFLVEERSSSLRVLIVAGLIIAAGMIPAYSIGYIMNNKLPPWNSRFSLPALLGLALVTTELINIVITSPKVRAVFVSTLLGLIIAHHNANTLNFKSAWEKQERFYQQLTWRAPSIETGAALISSEEFLTYMGDYPTSMAINTVYESETDEYIPYWFFTLSDPKANLAIANSEALTGSKASMNFLGTGSQAIYFTFEPENNQCLWVLRTEDAEHKGLPSSLQRVLLNTNRIPIREQPAPHKIYDQLVDENRNSWCYFYEKADLARQNGDWDTVIRYWEDAKEQGYRPRHGFEYIPFIEGYAHQEDWENAYELTRLANRATRAMYFILCPTWKRLATEVPLDDLNTSYYKKANEYLKCSE